MVLGIVVVDEDSVRDHAVEILGSRSNLVNGRIALVLVLTSMASSGSSDDSITGDLVMGTPRTRSEEVEDQLTTIQSCAPHRQNVRPNS